MKLSETIEVGTTEFLVETEGHFEANITIMEHESPVSISLINKKQMLGLAKLLEQAAAGMEATLDT